MKPDMAMDDVEHCGLSGDRVEQESLSAAGSDRARASRSARGQTGLSFALVVESALANSVTSGAHHDLSTRPEGGCGWGVGCGACALAALVMRPKGLNRRHVPWDCTLVFIRQGNVAFGPRFRDGERRTDPSLA